MTDHYEVHDPSARKLVDMICWLMQSEFYGELLIKMEAGQVVVIKKTETIKI